MPSGDFLFLVPSGILLLYQRQREPLVALASQEGLIVIPDNIVADNVVGNAKRISCIEDEYDRFRPAAPRMIVDIHTKCLVARGWTPLYGGIKRTGASAWKRVPT